MDEQIINFDDVKQKRKFLSYAGALRGVRRVTVVSHRKRRTDAQNRYWWGCYVTPFRKWMREEWGEPKTDLEAHSMLKQMFLKETVTDPTTGKKYEMVLDSHDLPTDRFARLIDDAGNFLADKCGIIVPQPGLYGLELNKV